MKFVGSTLWSDIDLAPDPIHFASIVEYGINDFSLIRRRPNRKFSAGDCQSLNRESRLFFRSEIKTPAKKVIMTHFLSCVKSIHLVIEDHALNPYFCCNCEDLIGKEASLWIHGHTHSSIDCVHKGTRIIANPRGYYGENPSFNGQLVVEV